MPVRLTDIPGLRSTQLNMPGVDPRVAAAPAMALGDVAEGIASVSTAFSKIGHSLQKQEDTTGELETKGVVDKVVRKTAEENRNDPNPANHVARAKKANAEVDKAVNSPHLSPAARAKTEAYAAGKKDQNLIAAGGSAAGQQVQQKRSALTSRMATAFENEDEDAFEDTLRIGQESGDYNDDQVTELRQKFQIHRNENDEQRAIHANPRGWLDQNSQPPTHGNIAKWSNNRDLAKRLDHDQLVKLNEDIQVGIRNGKITTDEDIDKASGGQRPLAVLQWKEELRRYKEEKVLKMKRTPLYQFGVIGEATERISNLDFDGDGYDEDYVAISGMLSEVTEGSPARKELERSLEAKRTGLLNDHQRSREARASAMLDESITTRPFPVQDGVSGMATTRAVGDGFLRDENKLLSLGFDKSQARWIMNGDFSPDDVTDKARTDRFREIYSRRAGLSTADGFANSTADAIMDNRQDVRYVDPEKEDAYISQRKEFHEQHGKMKSDLLTWVTNNPTVTDDQIKDEAIRLQEKALTDGIVSKERGKLKKDSDAVSRLKQPGTKARNLQEFSANISPNAKPEILAHHRKRVEALAKRHGIALKEHQKDALASFAEGGGQLDRLLVEGRDAHEISKAIPLYRNRNGRRDEALEKRRIEEQALFDRDYSPA